MSSIHQLLAAAFKAITVPGLGDARLVPQQAARFVRSMEDRAPLLRAGRLITMTADRARIDRITFGTILEAPAAEGEAFTGGADPSFETNELHAVKLRGRVQISDEAMLENIERDDFENTLVQTIGAGAGRDLENVLLNGDVTEPGLIGLTDGWLVKAANQITGAGSADFDPTDIEDMFQALLLSVESRFVEDRERLRFFVTFEMEDAYRDILRARGTDLGDVAQTRNAPVSYKGIRVEHVPQMPTGTALFTSVDNLVYGIRTDIEIEPERVAAADRTDHHVRVRGDCHFEDENGATVAVGYTG